MTTLPLTLASIPPASPAPRRVSSTRVYLLVAAWLLAVVAGMYRMTLYSMTPGTEASAVSRWPADSALSPPHGRALLLVFAHPHCPCTRATLAELARLMPRLGPGVEARVVFYHPAGTAPDWGGPGLRTQAAAIPGVTLASDMDGTEARRFGATTSGAAVLYTRDGELVFHGGLTAARGHEGTSAGTEAIAAWTQGHAHGSTAAPVFGCSLWDARALAHERGWLPTGR